MKINTFIKVFLERAGVTIISIFAMCLTYKYEFRIDKLKEYQSLLNNTISFASIFLGVLMTLVGLLLGYINKEVIKRIRIRNANDLLVKYFTYPISVGILLVVSSLILGPMLDEKIIVNNTTLIIISLSWVFLAVFFIASTVRIMILMLSILKEVFYEEVYVSESEHKVNKLNIDKCSYDDVDF